MNYRVELKDARKGFTLDQDKIISPGETVRRFKEKLKEVNLDILEETVRIDNGRLGIPVFFSVCGKDARQVIGTKKQMGKGGTVEQAEASAVMELGERFSFFSFAENPANFVVDTHKNLGQNAISLDQIAKSVHDDSDDLPAARTIFENLPMKWTWAHNMTQDKPVMVPFDWFFAINEFNGPSAGNCMEEALSQGICEIVERHVSSLVSRNRIRVPEVLTTSATDPVVLDMLGKYARCKIRLAISDFSLDMGIPTIGVLAHDPSTFPEKSEIVWTAGTTPDPQKSLSRALTEVAQLAGDFNSGSNYVASGLPKFSSLQEADFILNPGSRIDINDLPNLSHENIKVEVENLISALSRKNMDVIVINTTHDRLEIPALYTIVPGAHFRERAVGTSVAMFCAKLITENRPADSALKELTEIDKHLGEKYFIKFYMGLCHVTLDDPETALSFFEQALELTPTAEDIPSIYSYMGLCLKEMGRFSEALAVLEKGLALDAERTDILNLMGFCHFKLKNYSKAIEYFKKIIALNPSSAIDYANIAVNYQRMGENHRAIKYFQIALELDPNIEFAREGLEKLLG